MSDGGSIVFAGRGAVGLVRAELGVLALDAVLARLLVVTLDLALAAWPASGPCVGCISLAALDVMEASG